LSGLLVLIPTGDTNSKDGTQILKLGDTNFKDFGSKIGVQFGINSELGHPIKLVNCKVVDTNYQDVLMMIPIRKVVIFNFKFGVCTL
jgi:hypothetical protein